MTTLPLLLLLLMLLLVQDSLGFVVVPRPSSVPALQRGKKEERGLYEMQEGGGRLLVQPRRARRLHG